MQLRSMFAGAAVASVLFAGPALSAPVQTGTMDLHIEATAEIEPDTATVPMRLDVVGSTQEVADRNLEDLRRKLVDRLGALGIAPGKIAWTPSPVTDVRIRISAAAAAEAAADAATMVLTEANDRPRRRRDQAVEESLPSYAAGGTLVVTVEDLSRLAEVQAIGGLAAGDFMQARSTTYFVRGGENSRQAAIARAIAKARADADAYAAALGYRVVRMQRVSNARPVFNVPDMLSLMTRSEGPNRDPKLAGTVSASVAIDFVIAPN